MPALESCLYISMYSEAKSDYFCICNLHHSSKTVHFYAVDWFSGKIGCYGNRDHERHCCLHNFLLPHLLHHSCLSNLTVILPPPLPFPMTITNQVHIFHMQLLCLYHHRPFQHQKSFPTFLVWYHLMFFHLVILSTFKADATCAEYLVIGDKIVLYQRRLCPWMPSWNWRQGSWFCTHFIYKSFSGYVIAVGHMAQHSELPVASFMYLTTPSYFFLGTGEVGWDGLMIQQGTIQHWLIYWSSA